MKRKIAILTAIFCLLISVTGCGDSSKEQTFVIHDYVQNKKNTYDISNEKINSFVNAICDYLLDEESETVEISKEALNYIVMPILVFQMIDILSNYQMI